MEEKFAEKPAFSFAGGGAVATRLRELGVLRRGQLSLFTRIGLAIALTWLPLLALSAGQGLALGERVRIPFLFDFIQHARFLVALPAAIFAEELISARYESILGRLLRAEIVVGEDVPRLKRAIARANALKDSLIPELLVPVLIYLYLSFGLERDVLPAHSSWTSLEAGTRSLADRWFLWVSMPTFLFFWLRWIWRHGVWAGLLFQISKLKLRLISTHPDSAGGLAFISFGHRRYSVLFFSVSAILCASIGEEILFGGATLRSFELELTVFFLICLSVILGPLFAFSPPLIRSKLRDIGNYGVLSAVYAHRFDEKWVQGRKPPATALLGTPDFQSLADMQNSYRGIAAMRTILADPKTVTILFVAYLLPVIPLIMTVIPLRNILTEIFKLLKGL